jgi:hypothetical protein
MMSGKLYFPTGSKSFVVYVTVVYGLTTLPAHLRYGHGQFMINGSSNAGTVYMYVCVQQSLPLALQRLHLFIVNPDTYSFDLN